MISKWHLPPAPRPRFAPALSTWQRILVAGALAVALLLSGALIYFQPGSRSLTLPTVAPQQLETQVAPLPPGTDTYYYWGQHRPMDQQP